MALRKKTLKVQTPRHPTAGRRQSAAVRFGLAQRNLISRLDEVATKVPQLPRSTSLSHDNIRKTQGDPLYLQSCKATLAVARQCRKSRHHHRRLPSKARNRPPKYPSQRDQRLRPRHHPQRRLSPPILRLRPNPLWQGATRAANQKRTHRRRPCHRLLAHRPTRRNDARLSMVLALVRTRSRHHLLCLRASRQRSARGRVSYLHSDGRAMGCRNGCTTMHMYM